jgi:hypothetical protein
MDAKRKSGRVVADEEFPNDRREDYFLVLTKKGFSHKSSTKEEMKGRGEAELDAEDARALLGDGGVLSAGVAPTLAMQGGEASMKGLLEEATGEKLTKIKPAKTNDPKV